MSNYPRESRPGSGSRIPEWEVERIVHFEPGDLCKDGCVHFGFHGRTGRLYAVEHQKHFLGPVAEGDKLEWTLAKEPVFDGIANVPAELMFPIYVDSMPDGTLVVSNFGNARIYQVDVPAMRASLLVDGRAFGMKDMGNCVVDAQGCVWVNEVKGCKVWQFDSTGRPMRTLGDGTPGFQAEVADFHEVKFHWVYDLRLGPDGNIYVLDSRNFSVRMIDLQNRCVRTIAGTGRPGYEGDGASSRLASFGGHRGARFDGPISLSVDEEGSIFVGDRYNQVVRMIERQTGTIMTIAGRHGSRSQEKNDPQQRDLLRLNLPKISSMDYHNGRLFIPTDLTDDTGDLVVLRREQGVRNLFRDRGV